MTAESAIAARDYSQHGEQATILAWAADHSCGSFLDLGAYDGARYSNTAALADIGWVGLCVDAAPDAAAACAARYADRPDIDVILAAFDANGTSAPATVFWTPGLMYSALDPSKRDDVELTPILIPPVDLRWLSARAASLPKPFFCSIDLEGASIDALRWLLRETDPGCVCVEANNPRDRAEVAELLESWQRLAWNASNSVYARAAS